MLRALTAVAMILLGVPHAAASDDKAVLQVAELLRKAIVAQDIRAMVAIVHPSGIGCIDSGFTRKEWEAELRNPGSIMSAMFLDTPRWRENAQSVYEVLSVRDFFVSAKGVRTRVYDQVGHTKVVIFSADQPSQVAPVMEFSFAKDDTGRWRLVSIPNCG